MTPGAHIALRALYWALAALLAGIILTLLIVPAHGYEFIVRSPEFVAEKPDLQTPSWTPRTTGLLQLAAYAAVDYGQSTEAFFKREGHYELNPLLNERPSRRDLLAFGAAGIALTWLAGEVLPHPWAQIVLDSALASEGWNIEDNVRAADHAPRRINATPVIITLRW